MVYIAELYEQISRHPPGIAYRKLLVQHYMSVGNPWLAGALDEAKKLKALVPGDPDIDGYLKVLTSTSDPLLVERKSPAQVNQNDHYPKDTSSKPDSKVWGLRVTEPTGKRDDTKMRLATIYKFVAAATTLIVSKLLRFPKSIHKHLWRSSSEITSIQAVGNESNAASGSRLRTTKSARWVALSIRKNPNRGTNIATDDMEHTLGSHGIVRMP